MGRNLYANRYRMYLKPIKKPFFRTAFDNIMKIQLFHFYKLNIEN